MNETLGPQCWLAYLRNLKLSKGGTFDEAAAVAKTTVAAERTLENEKMRVTKCKEEAKAAVDAVAKKHLLGEEAVEWCSAMVAKKLLDGGAAKEAVKEAFCEWLIKPEMWRWWRRWRRRRRGGLRRHKHGRQSSAVCGQSCSSRAQGPLSREARGRWH